MLRFTMHLQPSMFYCVTQKIRLDPNMYGLVDTFSDKITTLYVLFNYMSYGAAFALENALSGNCSITSLYFDQKHCDSLQANVDSFAYLLGNLFNMNYQNIPPPEFISHFVVTSNSPLPNRGQNQRAGTITDFIPDTYILRTNGLLNDETRVNWLYRHQMATYAHILIDGIVGHLPNQTFHLVVGGGIRLEFSISFANISDHLHLPDWRPIQTPLMVFTIFPNEQVATIRSMCEYLATDTITKVLYEGPLAWTKEDGKIKLGEDQRWRQLLDFYTRGQQPTNSLVMSFDILIDNDDFKVKDFDSALQTYIMTNGIRSHGLVLNLRLLQTSTKTIEWLSLDVVTSLQQELAPFGYFEAWFRPEPFPYIMKESTDPVRYELPWSPVML